VHFDRAFPEFLASHIEQEHTSGYQCPRERINFHQETWISSDLKNQIKEYKRIHEKQIKNIKTKIW
jgi:hypothetical protein